MKVVRHNAAADFLDRAGAWLETAEAENNLILGIVAYFKSYVGQLRVRPYFLTLEESGAIVGAALMTLPRRLLITTMPDTAVTTLADFMLAETVMVPGTLGPKSEIVISWVYTPAHLRRRGYATACVAALSQRMLDSGKSFCCLYTDLANSTSNSIYQKIGYRPVAMCRIGSLGSARPSS